MMVGNVVSHHTPLPHVYPTASRWGIKKSIINYDVCYFPFLHFHLIFTHYAFWRQRFAFSSALSVITSLYLLHTIQYSINSKKLCLREPGFQCQIKIKIAFMRLCRNYLSHSCKPPNNKQPFF